MSEEELEKVKGIVKRLYAGTGVTIGDIVDTAPWLDKLVNEVEELQKENEELNKKNKRYEKYLKNKDIEHEKVLEYIETEKEHDYISKDIIRDKIKELKKAPVVYSLTIDILEELLEEIFGAESDIE